MTRTSILLLTLALAACGRPAPDVANGNTAATSAGATEPVVENRADATPARPTSYYAGRWIGVEGMFLQVTPMPAGGVELAMQSDLDHAGVYRGKVTAEGLRFTRDGVIEIARPTDGDATGLKWLADKKECLTVKTGEGYCR